MLSVRWGLLRHGVGQQVLEVGGACGPLQRRLLATAAHQRALLTAGHTVTAHTLQTTKTPQSLKQCLQLKKLTI